MAYIDCVGDKLGEALELSSVEGDTLVLGLREGETLALTEPLPETDLDVDTDRVPLGDPVDVLV